MSSESKDRPVAVEEPETLAKYFKFYIQYTNPRQFRFVPLERVGFKGCYNENKKYFDKLSVVCSKYKINAQEYIKFCVLSRVANTPEKILSVECFKKYADTIALKERYATIYKNYMRSAKNIAIYCIENGKTPLEYLKSLIVNNQLGYEYATGNLSKHYIASLQNFKKLFYRLDRINRDELSTIHNVASELNDEIQSVFLMYKNQRAKPISLAEAMIIKIKNS